MQRKEAILLAATEHFGRYGFRGASLRDIARDAGVSLTLLNHHFGSKASLLSAAVDSHRRLLDERTSALSAVQHAGPGSWGVHELVQAWVRSAAANAATAEGRRFLQLVTRISEDTSHEFDPDVQTRVDAPARAFVEALQRCRPEASRRAAESACLWLRGAVSRFLLGAQRLSEPHVEDGVAVDIDQDDETRLVSFLAAGIEAALDAPTTAHAAGVIDAQESALAE